MAAYDVTSRPFIQNCQWIWPRTDIGDRVHTKANFSTNGAIRSRYVIHPDWISEHIRPGTPESSLHRATRRRSKSFYVDKPTILRERIHDEMIDEAHVSKLHLDKHYQVQHNSPWYINNPSEVMDSNVLFKTTHSPVHLAYLEPWNNAREVLFKEGSLPPLKERFAMRDPQPMSVLTGPEMSEEEKCRFRFLSGQYKTMAEW